MSSVKIAMEDCYFHSIFSLAIFFVKSFDSNTITIQLIYM